MIRKKNNKEKGKTMKKYIRYIIGFAGLSFIVLFHEFGHFIVAKLFNLQTPIFSIGFGPALLKTTIGQTTFQFSALPLGGYVTFNPEELKNQIYIIKLLIALAGVVFNGILSYLIFVGLVFRGTYQTTTTIDHVIDDSPAQKAGLKENDIVVSFADKQLQNTPKGFTDFAQTIAHNPNKEFIMQVIRNNQTETVTAQLSDKHPLLGDDIGWLGIAWKQEKMSSPGIIQSLTDGYRLLGATLSNLGALSTELFQQGKKNKITGPIGIMNAMARSLQFGKHYYAMSIALISLNVGIFNLLPIPFLDGGRIVQFTLETIFGPLPTSTIIIVTLFIFFMMLQILSIFMRPQTKQ